MKVEGSEAGFPPSSEDAVTVHPSACTLHPRGHRRTWPDRLALAYLLLVVAVALVSRMVAERQWWSTLLIYLPQVLYLAPLSVTLPPALWVAGRRRALRPLVINGLTALLILGPIMGLNGHLPLPGPVRGSPRVRVLAYNIHSGTGRWGAIQEQFDHYQPDVVVLSEAIDWRGPRASKEELRRRFPGWSSVGGGDVYVFSRWPFAATDVQPLGTMVEGDASLDRAKVRATVAAPFGQFHVLGVHFRTAIHGRNLRREWQHVPTYMRHTGGVRLDQSRDLLGYTARLEGPIILAGDFNTPPAGLIYDGMRRGFGDAFSEAGWGWGYTYPTNVPLLRIDYIYHSRHWHATASEVGRQYGSDHRPVFGELALSVER